MRSVHARFVLALSLSGLLAAGCSSNEPSEGGNGGTPGTGGAGKTGGTPGSGGSPSGGTGGTPSSGTGGTPSSGTGGTPSSGTGGTPAATDGGTPDTGSSTDTGTPSAGNITCGTTKAAVTTMGSAEGIVIAPDGTLYHSQSFAGNFLSRIRPGMPEEKDWVMVGAQMLGITYDPKLKVVYGGSRSRRKILKIEVDKMPPVVTELADAEGGVNGVTLGEDYAVYYADQTGGRISRVAADGTKTEVTMTPIPGGPNGLAFGPDKKLYINQYSGRDVVRLTLDAMNKEVSRETFITLPAGGGDGIAFDKMGRMYVTAGGLHQVGTDGKLIKTIPGAQGANIDFGVGVLSCTDLYTGGNNGGIKIVTLDAPGMDVPWHRAP